MQNNYGKYLLRANIGFSDELTSKRPFFRAMPRMISPDMFTVRFAYYSTVLKWMSANVICGKECAVLHSADVLLLGICFMSYSLFLISIMSLKVSHSQRPCKFRLQETHIQPTSKAGDPLLMLHLFINTKRTSTSTKRDCGDQFVVIKLINLAGCLLQESWTISVWLIKIFSSCFVVSLMWSL